MLDVCRLQVEERAGRADDSGEGRRQQEDDKLHKSPMLFDIRPLIVGK